MRASLQKGRHHLNKTRGSRSVEVDVFQFKTDHCIQPIPDVLSGHGGNEVGSLERWYVRHGLTVDLEDGFVAGIITRSKGSLEGSIDHLQGLGVAWDR